ncbi:hypothetical protein [Methanobrevibacter sp. UBA212]|nr:hypothetical protein [Methanobrevibacter sp. UBA212]
MTICEKAPPTALDRSIVGTHEKFRNYHIAELKHRIKPCFPLA